MIGWRWLLFPFGFLYWCITILRNLAFDLRLRKSTLIRDKSICIGNLNVGGSGKSPMTLFLLKKLQSKHPITLLSRGYGRSTKGHIHLNESHQASEVGDEPLMYYSHKSDRDEVHVSESRLDAIRTLSAQPNRVLLLDDAFQHRQIRAGLNVLISDFSAPFFKDYILPIGKLREPRWGARRAQTVVFSKCPDIIDDKKRSDYEQWAKYYGLVPFFSRIIYSPLKTINHTLPSVIENVVLVTGIANPIPLKEYLEKSFKVFSISFTDHHDFKPSEIKEIHDKFDTFDPSKTIIITTEKDFMRLNSPVLKNELLPYPWFVQPIELEIENEAEFLKLIHYYVN